jgi:hypothetical protein
LDEHAFDRDLTPVKFAGKNEGTVAPRAKLIFCIDLDVPHPNDRARHGLHIIRHRQNIWFELR